MEIFMADLQTKKYRYERKYIIDRIYGYKLLSELHKKNFKKRYNDRHVNNIYLDNSNFNSISENFDGLSNRKKTRIRWYGEKFVKNDKFLEFKIKNEFLNTKKIYYLSNSKLNSLLEINNFFTSQLNFARHGNNNAFKQITGLEPKLFNCYLRSYFTNMDEDIRITIDKNIFYYSPVTKMSHRESKLVIEVKYEKEMRFINNFNYLNYTRYSKYVKGCVQTSYFSPNY